jgi:hypothetical protein
MTSTNSDLVSGDELARWLGVSRKEIYDLGKAGILFRVGRAYRLEESVRRYCEHQRRPRHQQNVIMPTTKSVERVCALLDDVIESFIRTRNETLRFGKYEAAIEARLLFNLAIRHTEGVIALARHDLILLPSAQMAARAGFEAAIKAAWLVDADDPFDREARWLAHLSSEERYLSRSANELSEAEQNATVSPQVREVRLARAEQLRKWEASVRDFRLEVAEMLPPDVVRLKGIPTFKDMLASLGGQKLYSLYVYLSQTAHAEHNATWLYRTGGLGTKKRIGEFVSPSDWGGPLRTSFLNFAHPSALQESKKSRSPRKVRPSLSE